MSTRRRPAEPDIPANPHHPSRTIRLVGQDAALQRSARAIRSGQPAHAWLLCGPPGIGKATLAYRMARYLLRFGATATGPDDLSVPANDPVIAQVAAESHPGLLVLQRRPDPATGRMPGVLQVEEIRRLSSFFGLTASGGGWRVAIVDSADDMNPNAANALLKMLEEPPARGLLILVAHTPGRLLPTIRSRCRRLDLRPLAPETVADELSRLQPEIDAAARTELARLANGSLGLALQLADPAWLAFAKEADRIIDGAADPGGLLALAEKLGRMPGDGLDSFAALLVAALERRIRAKAEGGAEMPLDRWITAWEEVKRSLVRTSALNLEPRQTLVLAGHTIRHAITRAGPV